MKTKTCSKCKRDLPLSEYYNKKGARDGLAYECKDCFRKHIKKWQKENPEQMKRSVRIRNRRNRTKRRARSLIKLADGTPICAICGFEDIRALQIDHINEDGAAERLKGLHVNKLVNQILKMSDVEARKKYQVLCANCNWIKHAEQRGWYRSLLIQSTHGGVRGRRASDVKELTTLLTRLAPSRARHTANGFIRLQRWPLWR